MKNFILTIFGALVWCGLDAQEFSVATNVLDLANMGTLNVSAAYGFSRHWSVEVGIKYNPFTWGEGDSTWQNRQRSLSAGARYWPWYVWSGWWLEGALRYKEYNVGGFSDSATSEGDRLGPVLRLGYAHMLTRDLNLDIGAGVWGAWDRYVVYSCPTCGKILDQGQKVFLLPSDVMLSLTYIF